MVERHKYKSQSPLLKTTSCKPTGRGTAKIMNQNTHKPHTCTCEDVEPGTYANQILVHAPAHMPKDNGYCLDKCIAEEVMILWQLGITTTGCCCGHGKPIAFIGVDDADIPRMKAWGYQVHLNSTRPGNEDSFAPLGKEHVLAILLNKVLDGYFAEVRADSLESPDTSLCLDCQIEKWVRIDEDGCPRCDKCGITRIEANLNNTDGNISTMNEQHSYPHEERVAVEANMLFHIVRHYTNCYVSEEDEEIQRVAKEVLEGQAKAIRWFANSIGMTPEAVECDLKQNGYVPEKVEKISLLKHFHNTKA